MIEIRRQGQILNPQKVTASTDEARKTGTASVNEARKTAVFASIDGRNYNAMYRAVVDLQKRHSPPVSGDKAAIDAYWLAVNDDITAVCDSFGQDAFISRLLVAVFEELEREFYKAQQAQQGKPTGTL